MAQRSLPVVEPQPEPGLPPEDYQQPSRQERAIAGLRLLWSARKSLARAATIAFCLSLALAFLLPKRYESTTRIMPPDSKSLSSMSMAAAMASKAGGALGGAALDLLGMKDSGATFISILQSRTVQDRLIDRFNLMHVYGYRYRKDARKKLAERTDISEDRKSGVISVTVTDRDAQRAAAMARAYIDELNRLAAELNTSAAHRERVFIGDRLKTVKQDLDQASKEFSEFASKNTAIDIKEQGKAMVEAAATLQGQLIAAQSELQGLEQVYTANNVRVRSLQARVGELKHQLEKLGGTDASLAAGSNPGGQPAELYPSIRKLPLLGVQYANLYQQTKIQETVYELLTQQYELAKIEEAKEIPSVKVLDEADVPEKKSFPPRLLIGVMGMLMSFLLACAWVIGVHKWERIDQLDSQKVFAQEVYATLRSDCQRLWRRRRHLPKDMVTGTLGWFSSSNDRNGDEQ
ncbi:MAG: Wzz/FepE/Etk N-terminal domain-containing protein [Terriglobales bacterium]